MTSGVLSFEHVMSYVLSFSCFRLTAKESNYCVLPKLASFYEHLEGRRCVRIGPSIAADSYLYAIIIMCFKGCNKKEQ